MCTGFFDVIRVFYGTSFSTLFNDAINGSVVLCYFLYDGDFFCQLFTLFNDGCVVVVNTTNLVVKGVICGRHYFLLIGRPGGLEGRFFKIILGRVGLVFAGSEWGFYGDFAN